MKFSGIFYDINEFCQEFKIGILNKKILIKLLIFNI